MTISNIKIHGVQTSMCADFAVDVALGVTLNDGRIIEGEVTLVPGDYDDTKWVSWGSLDHWMSDSLISVCQDEDEDDIRSVADQIEVAAAKAAAECCNAWEVAAARDKALYE